ncbi:MAG: hypothetical protein IT440_09340 [Phycisphaeraceae bacterium]|nr:hypothetical protein [Phycisphaeraceae bacterium]
MAEELIAHFADGLESGVAAETLVRDFGDARLAARLIRRAKVRQRPALWHLWRLMVWGYVAVVVLYGLLAVRFYLSKPTIAVDYLAKFNAPAKAVPESDRAWPLYRQALTEMGYVQRPTCNVLSLQEQLKACLTRMKEHPQAMTLIRQAAAKPGLGFVTTTSYGSFSPEDHAFFYPDRPREAPEENDMLMAVLLPQLQALRYAAWHLEAEAQRALDAGDAQLVMDDLTALLGVARHFSENRCYIPVLWDTGTQLSMYQVLGDVLHSRRELLSSTQLRDLAHRIVSQNVPFCEAMEGERMSLLDLVQHCYTDDGRGNGRITGEGIKQLRWGLEEDANTGLLLHPVLMPCVRWFAGSRQDLMKLINQNIDITESQMERPLYEQGNVDPYASLNQEIKALGWCSPSRWVLPYYGIVAATRERYLAHREGAIIGIALELYRREYGDYPAKLDALVPAYLPTLPVDRITGGPLLYHVTDGQPVVYSVGADRDDDGGRRGTDLYAPSPGVPGSPPSKVDTGDWVIWPQTMEAKAMR